MPNISHSALTGSELHEPKGVASATAGKVYVADGAGSGAWEYPLDYAGIYTLESDAVTVSTIGTTPKTLPFSNDGPEKDQVADSANNRITATTAGVYMVFFSISFSTVAAGDAGLYEFKLMDDGVATGYGCARQMSGTSDTGSASFIALISGVGAGSQLTIQVESDNGSNTDDISIYTANFEAFRIGS